MRTLIIGCGYVGEATARLLTSQGHEVLALRRTRPPSPPEGVVYLQGDITRPEDLEKIEPNFDWIINTVSSTRGGVEDYESVYFRGTQNILKWCQTRPPRKYVYTSSTSVYAQNDGSTVKETSPTTPDSPTSQVLVRVEELLLREFAESRFPSIILRVAGIYGPDRGHFFQQYLKNEARIAGDGTRLMNMIHREDVAGVIARALLSGRAGEVFNAVDDEPVTQTHFFRWLSETLGKWMPPYTPEATDPNRKRGITNKKVSNRKLKVELGYVCKYPTFRQGYTAEILALERAGLLNIEPEPR